MARVVSVIITYNGAGWIRGCISSLIRDRAEGMDVLVLDNCSSDDTASIVKNEFPQARLVKLSSNMGFGKANNVGLEFALKHSYDHVFLLNQDAWISSGSIGELVRLQEVNAEYGIVSPIQLRGDGETVDWLFGDYIVPASCPGLYSDALLGKLRPLYEVAFVNAAAWLMSAGCLRAVGGFDPIFPHYGEDNDYVSRVRSRGFKVGVTPNVFVCHDRPQSKRATGGIDVYREYITNLVELKRPDWSTRFAARVVIGRLLNGIRLAMLRGEFGRSMELAQVLRKVSLNLPKVFASRRQMTGDICPYLRLPPTCDLARAEHAGLCGEREAG